LKTSARTVPISTSDYNTRLIDVVGNYAVIFMHMYLGSCLEHPLLELKSTGLTRCEILAQLIWYTTVVDRYIIHSALHDRRFIRPL